MSDLVAFLRARLDEDEAVAQAATPGPWKVRPRREGPGVLCVDAGEYDEVIAPGAVSCGSYCYGGTSSVDISDADAAYITRHDPARVLAEVAAKRAMLNRCVEALSANQNRMEGYEIHQNDGERYVSGDIIAVLAAVYASHPDYREEWKP